MGRYVLAASSAFLGLACLVLAALGPVAAQQVLDNIAAADAMYQDFPPKETLPPEELAAVIEAWDAALESNDLRGIGEAIDFVVRGVPRPYRLHGAHVLRYDNPEIEDRVVNLYLWEVEMKEAGLLSYDVAVASPKSEFHQDYMDLLGTLAHSTFSPHMYDTVLKWHFGGLHEVYLASVYPETTLELLLQTTLRERTSPRTSPDILDHSDPDIHFGSVDDALKLLAVLCERSPDVVLAEQDRVLDFVRTHALHYVEPIEVSYRPEPRYRDVLDYGTRVLALKTLELFAEAQGVYTIVDDLMRNPPKNPSSASGNEIIKLGERIIEQIRALE